MPYCWLLITGTNTSFLISMPRFTDYNVGWLFMAVTYISRFTVYTCYDRTPTFSGAIYMDIRLSLHHRFHCIPYIVVTGQTHSPDGLIILTNPTITAERWVFGGLKLNRVFDHEWNSRVGLYNTLQSKEHSERENIPELPKKTSRRRW